MALPFLIAVSALVLAAAAVLARTLAFKPPLAPRDVPPKQVPPASEAAIQRLSHAIQIPTVCAQQVEDTDFAPFDLFIVFLAENWPLFHRRCELTVINGRALLYRWRGKDALKPPVLMTAHYDVVPAQKRAGDAWKYPPFSGKVAGGFIWGRGALDIKSQLTAHMEAAEDLMREGFVPARDFLFAYGFDEEVGGRQGALKLAEYMKASSIRPEGVLDEGGFAVTGVLKGVKAPLALIGVAEKGFCNYTISIEGEGGHASMPPRHSALGSLAALLAKIEAKQMQARLSAPAKAMLRNVAGEMGFGVRMAVANLWLFRPLLLRVLCAAPATAAMVRTTQAVTVAKGSTAANVLPARAEAVINVRLLPGDSCGQMAERYRALGKGRFTVTPSLAEEPSQVSPASGVLYGRLIAHIKDLYPGAIATPYLVMGGTDARKYYSVCDNVYRFTPVLVSGEEKDTVHGSGERISTENYSRMIYFYHQFIENFE